MHLGRIVDRPHVHGDAAAVAAADEPDGDDRDTPTDVPAPGGSEPNARPVSLIAANSHWPAAVHSRRPRAAAHVRDAAIAERGEAHPIEGTVAGDHVGQRSNTAFTLAVDVEASVGPGVEQLVERRNRLVPCDAHRGDLGGA